MSFLALKILLLAAAEFFHGLFTGRSDWEESAGDERPDAANSTDSSEKAKKPPDESA